MWQPGITLAEVEQETIIAALRFYHGNRTHAASALGISRRSMTNFVKKYKDQGVSVPIATRLPSEQEEAPE
jgi:two-component system response regulator FlrC